MPVLLAETFMDAIARLQPDEQLRTLDFVQRFREDPSNPGISLERVQSGGDNVWSGRVTRDIRAILFREGDLWALLYVGHHQPAYQWAERRAVARHPVTGALQIVATEVTVVQREQTRVVARQPRRFEDRSDDYLLSMGLPPQALAAVREVRDDDELVALCEQLPEDVALRLMDVAEGRVVAPPTPVPAAEPWRAAAEGPWQFHVVENPDELRLLLLAPLARWLAFLHPSQRRLVEGDFSGPVKVSGSAGTGKTVVAMHRARWLARRGQRVLLTSYVNTLVQNLARQLGTLCTAEELERITVSTVLKSALDLVAQVLPGLRPANEDDFLAALGPHLKGLDPPLDAAFARAEWRGVVYAQGLVSWEEYRSAPRLGRGQALGTRERKLLWDRYARAYADLWARGQRTWPELCRQATEALREGRARGPYDAVIVDELQDLTAWQLAFVQALANRRPEQLMLVGDAGQRIYAGGFTLQQLGIPVRGRSFVLRVNYRTSEQIRRSAERLLEAEADDMDGGREARSGTRSLFGGPVPALHGFATAEAEQDHIVTQVRGWLAAGTAPGEVGLFARVGDQALALAAALEAAGVPVAQLKDGDSAAEAVQVGTMHRAKGLEFKRVVVAGCAEGTLPHRQATRQADPLDREQAMAREKRLLYVAMTRARDELLLTWSGAPSPFLAVLLSAEAGS